MKIISSILLTSILITIILIKIGNLYIKSKYKDYAISVSNNFDTNNIFKIIRIIESIELLITIFKKANFYIVHIENITPKFTNIFSEFNLLEFKIKRTNCICKIYNKDLEYVLFEIDKELIKIKKLILNKKG